jgi:hypothetical protein
MRRLIVRGSSGFSTKPAAHPANKMICYLFNSYQTNQIKR